MYQIIISLLENIIFIVPILMTVAFVTVAERKTMASMQRRLGPNIVGYFGLLQAFVDALKLLLKEYVSPTQSNIILFFKGRNIYHCYFYRKDLVTLCLYFKSIINTIKKDTTFSKTECIIFILFMCLIVIRYYWSESVIYSLIVQIHVGQFIIFCVHKIIIDKFGILKSNFIFVYSQIKRSAKKNQKLILIGIFIITLIIITLSILYMSLLNLSYIAFLIILRKNISKYIFKYLKHKIMLYTHIQAKKRIYIYRKLLAIFQELLEFYKLISLFVEATFITNYHFALLAILIEIGMIFNFDHNTNMAVTGLYLYALFTYNSAILKKQYPIIHNILTYIFEFIFVLSSSYFIDIIFSYFIESLLNLGSIIKMNVTYWCLTGRQPTNEPGGSLDENGFGLSGGGPTGPGGGNGGSETVFATPINNETRDSRMSIESNLNRLPEDSPSSQRDPLFPGGAQVLSSKRSGDQTISPEKRQKLSVANLLTSNRRSPSPKFSINKLLNSNQKQQPKKLSIGELLNRNKTPERRDYTNNQFSRSPQTSISNLIDSNAIRNQSLENTDNQSVPNDQSIASTSNQLGGNIINNENPIDNIQSNNIQERLDRELPYINDGNYGDGHVCPEEEKSFPALSNFNPPSDITVYPGRVNINGGYVSDIGCLPDINCGHKRRPRVDQEDNNVAWDLKWGRLPEAGDLNRAKVMLENRNRKAMAMTPLPCHPCISTIDEIWGLPENSTNLWVNDCNKTIPTFDLTTIAQDTSANRTFLSLGERAEKDLKNCLDTIQISKNKLNETLNKAEQTQNGSVLHHVGFKALTRLLSLDASYGALENHFSDKDISKSTKDSLHQLSANAKKDFKKNLRSYNQKHVPWRKNYCNKAIFLLWEENKKSIKIDENLGK